MKIVFVRRISQVFFAALFVWFCVVTTVGTAWWQWRGWPVNWLLQLDPLVALGTLLTTHTVYAGLLWALVTIVLTIFLGRFFCSWLCPFGSLHHFVGYMARRGLKFAQRVNANQYRRGQAIKYYLLIFLLTAAAGDLIGRLLRAAHDEPALPLIVLVAALLVLAALAGRAVIASFRRTAMFLLVLVAAWIGLGFIFSTGQIIVPSLQTGLLDPIPLIHRSVNMALLPLLDPSVVRHYEGVWLIGGVFLTAVLLNFVVPRFYCRFLCPLGALFGVLGRYAIWRIGKVEGHCSGCELCEDNCEGACEPFEKVRISECLLCMNCRDACRQAKIAYATRPSVAGEITSPDVTRRGFLIAAVSGAAAVPLMRVGGLTGTNWNPRVIRPPGALGETDFLDRCIKCGQCMRVCPTNIIQPAGLQAGLEGLWTPLLNFRIGTSGCQLNCIACGYVCPTAAIRPLQLDEKIGRGEFAKIGPIRMGTAFVDRGRCLPWAMDKPCIVCQENCPVSPKAIFLREEFSAVRDGALVLQETTADTVLFRDGAMRPGRFATGDYFCKIGEQRRRIVANTADSVTLAVHPPWISPPAPGSIARIEVRLQQPYVDPELCTGCGVCERECPVSGLRAIRVTAENESRNRKHALVL